MRKREGWTGIFDARSCLLERILGTLWRAATDWMRFQHDTHVHTIVCRTLKCLNDVRICQQIHLQPDRLLRASNRIGNYLLTRIRLIKLADSSGPRYRRCASLCGNARSIYRRGPIDCTKGHHRQRNSVITARGRLKLLALL